LSHAIGYQFCTLPIYTCFETFFFIAYAAKVGDFSAYKGDFVAEQAFLTYHAQLKTKKFYCKNERMAGNDEALLHQPD